MKKTQGILMKCRLFLSIILLLAAFPKMVTAQSTPVIYQNWKMIGESNTHYEVSARIIRCQPDSAAQLHIELFNEGTSAQTARFKLTITNPATSENIVREITYAMALGEMIMPLCENNSHPTLRINLPSNWDPATVTFTSTFIQ